MPIKLLFSIGLVLIQTSTMAQPPNQVFVHFASDKWQLTAPARATLDSLTDSLSATDRIELHGHCDSDGTGLYNERLSQKRVKSVLDYLVSLGWEKKDILVSAGHGENNPLNNNSTPEERGMNRRVEIKIIRAGNDLTTQLGNPSKPTGSNIILSNINFEGGKHRLLPESLPVLNELLSAMRTWPRLVIRVEGHICCSTGPEDGTDLETGLDNLSEARAKAVCDFLIENGIAPERVSYLGFGHSRPLYPFPEKSEEQSKLNRRVEIKIISR
jgi:outer membrane protein OmpA-like peptidoglycan-associated protein